MANEFGRFLEKLRGNKSLREAASKSGLSHTYIRDLELGTNRVTKTPIRPTPETLQKLSEAYDHPYEELMKLAGYIAEDEEINKTADGKTVGEYMDLNLTNEEIKQRLTFKVDNMLLTDEEIEDFLSYVRWTRAKKKAQSAASKSDEA